MARRKDHVSVRLDAAIFARVDAWIPGNQSDLRKVTRSDVLRALIDIALEHVALDSGAEFRALLERPSARPCAKPSRRS